MLVSQEKVIEKSGKKPDWVNGIEINFVIESGKGSTLDEAKNQALLRVKDNIVNSVAVKVSSQTETSTSENRIGNTYSIKGSYVEQIKTKTANLPAIKGISENKVREYYWEKIKNKKAGTIICYYFLKYPFSGAELNQIIFEYKEAQRSLRAQLEAAISEIDELTTIEVIIERLNMLRNLSKQLEDDNKAIAAINIGKLEDLLKAVHIQETACSEDIVKYFLVYGNRRLTTSQNPILKSNCAFNFRQQSVGDTMLIIYDSKGCRKLVTNTLSVEYRFECKPIKAEFQLASTFAISNLKISEGTQFVILKTDSTHINHYKIILPILLQSNESVVLRNVTITLSRHPMLTFDNVNGQTLNEGLNTIELTNEFPLQKTNYTFENYEIVLMSGSITYTNRKTNYTSACKFYNEMVAVVVQE